MVKITPCRSTISDRFPVASFVVQVPPHRWFEVACATDPRLFHVAHRGQRSERNFATSRAGGLMRAPSGQATYIVPPDQLRRFAGATRLYYAVGSYGGARGEDPVFTITPDALEATPWIQLSADFTGRALDRGRIAKQPQRYGGEQVNLAWGGDDAMMARGATTGPNGKGSSVPPMVPRPAPYNDGFDDALWTETDEGPDPRYLEAKNDQVAAAAMHQRRADAEASGSLSFLPVRGIEYVSEAFKDKAYDIAQDLGVDVNNLMAVMSFETGGTFSPSVRNAAGSGAVGLIQFMPSTAKGLGTTSEKLAAMSAEEQLDWVHKYLRPFSGKMSSVEDAYMAVLWPAAVGKGTSHVLFSEGSKAYEQNKGLDANGDGEVTVAEAAGKVRAILDAAQKKVSEGQAVYGAPWHWATAQREERGGTRESSGHRSHEHRASSYRQSSGHESYGERADDEPSGYEDAPSMRALALGDRPGVAATPLVFDDEPDGYEDGAAMWAAEEDGEGYEDGPDLMRRLGAAARDGAARDGAARYGRRTAARPVRSARALADEAPAPAAPVDMAGRYFDYSDEPLPIEELPDVMPAAQSAEPDGAPLEAMDRLGIIHYVAQFESGASGYSAINADGEYEDPRLPRFYHARHVGLSWGLVQFAQGPGSLGFVLEICARRDPDEFARRFGPNHQELLRVTCAPTWAERLAPVVPPGGTDPRVLWDPAWTRVFAAAGEHRAFQEAQREAADRRFYEPFAGPIAWLGLTSPRGQAAFVDRAVHMGGEAALAWVVKTVSPIRTRGQLADALRLVGAADLRGFQESFRAGSPYGPPAGLTADGQFGPRTHAALLGALRRRGAEVPPDLAPTSESAAIARLVDAARQRADAGMAQSPPDSTWTAIHRRLSRIADDPALATLPRAP
jgi:hypothetical protein